MFCNKHAKTLGQFGSELINAVKVKQPQAVTRNFLSVRENQSQPPAAGDLFAGQIVAGQQKRNSANRAFFCIKRIRTIGKDSLYVLKMTTCHVDVEQALVKPTNDIGLSVSDQKVILSLGSVEDDKSISIRKFGDWSFCIYDPCGIVDKVQACA